MKKLLVLVIFFVMGAAIHAQGGGNNKNAFLNPFAIADPIVFNDYYLFYQHLTNTSELGFDWIFNSKNPDSLEIKFVYIYPNSPFAKAVDFSINYNITTIIAIDGKPTAKMKREDASHLMSGKPGTNCVLTLRIKNTHRDINLDKAIKSETYTSVARNNYDKGVAAFKKAKIDDALKWFSDYSYPESQIILFKIYSGRILDEINITNKDVSVYKKLRGLVNLDSIRKYSVNILENPTITALVSLYCYGYKFNTPELTTVKNILTKKAANDGDVRSQELMAYLHAWHFSYDDLISKDILPDKQQAIYWYKRALAGGSKEGPKMEAAIADMRTSQDVKSIDIARNRVFTFKDAKAVTKVAHLKHGLMGIIPDYILPFGINGFEDGELYTGEKSHFPFTWTTHIIKDRDVAIKNFEDAAYVFSIEFSKYDFKDIKWYNTAAQEGNLLKYNAAKFTALENDGTSYKMQMLLYLEAVRGGYQINLQYSEEK